MPPMTVPMKKGVSSEERANVAPRARFRLGRETSLRNAKPAPRSTIPSTASQEVPQAAAEVGAAKYGVEGDRGQQDGPDRGRDHLPARPRARSSGPTGGPYGTAVPPVPLRRQRWARVSRR